MPHSKKRYVVNFPAHLADCEFNYRRLRRLMPGWRTDTTDTFKGGGLSSSELSSGDEEEALTDPIDKSLTNNKEWRYIIGYTKNSEMALLIKVADVAKYTTTVHVAVHPSLHNRASWNEYLRCDAQKSQSTEAKTQISMADIQGSVTMLSSRFKSYSFEVRLYHDATVAEVIAWEGRSRFKARHDYPNPRMYHSDEKAQLNRFLGELLELCLTQGRVLDNVTITG
ncbi:MAG: hypothetical protein ACJAUP_002661 [Cellvibrionaceae bacterium]|jgi:uncharacterized protein YqiB (DUF1249 family)